MNSRNKLKRNDAWGVVIALLILVAIGAWCIYDNATKPVVEESWSTGKITVFIGGEKIPDAERPERYHHVWVK